MTRIRSRPTPKRTGEKLLAIRKSLGLSQSQMVRRLNFNCHYGRISDYETGKRYPTVLALLAYARLGQVSLESLVDDDLELVFKLTPTPVLDL